MHPPAHSAGVRKALTLLAVLAAPLPAQAGRSVPPEAASPAMQRFVSYSHTFQLDLPEGWRQLAPGEIKALQTAVPNLPLDILRNEPRMFYTVGPIDRWLTGDFDGVYLYVLEQGNEWHTSDAQLRNQLQQMWQEKGSIDGVRHELESVARTTAGPDAHPVIRCIRTSTPETGGRAERHIDIYAPTGGRQVSLSFTCPPGDFAKQEPRFEAMIQSLALARRARGEQSLEDRLWTPLITGSVIGIVLILLYRHTRRPPA